MPNQPSGFFLLEWKVAKSGKSIPLSNHPKGEETRVAPGSVKFLGQELSRAEYDEACRNLGQFFRLLREWAKKAEINEKTDSAT